jgi:hypothetical protein
MQKSTVADTTAGACPTTQIPSQTGGCLPACLPDIQLAIIPNESEFVYQSQELF